MQKVARTSGRQKGKVIPVIGTTVSMKCRDHSLRKRKTLRAIREHDA